MHGQYPPMYHQQPHMMMVSQQQPPADAPKKPKAPRANSKKKAAAAMAAAAAGGVGGGGGGGGGGGAEGDQDDDADTNASVADSDGGGAGVKRKRSGNPAPALKKAREGSSPDLTLPHYAGGVGGGGGIAFAGYAPPPGAPMMMMMHHGPTTEDLMDINNELDPRPTLEGMGIHVGADRTAAAEVIGTDVVSQEALLARQKMRDSVRSLVASSMPSSSSSSSFPSSSPTPFVASSTAQAPYGYYVQHRAAHPPAGPAKVRPQKLAAERQQAEEDAVVAGEDFSFPDNIVDSGLLEVARLRLERESGMRVGIDTLEFLSHGLQIHLTNIVEGAIVNSRKRRNLGAGYQFQYLHAKCLVKGEVPGPNGMALVWGPEVAQVLEREELTARAEMMKREGEEEAAVIRTMQQHEEDKDKAKTAATAGPAASRRKPGGGDSDEPWWVKEDAAEKLGLLDFDGLARWQFRHDVARENRLGPYASKKSLATSKVGQRPRPGSDAAAHAARAAADAAAAAVAATGTAHWDQVKPVNEAMKDVGLASSTLPDMVTKSDVQAVLKHVARPRGGGPRSAMIGTALQRSFFT